MSNDYEIFKGKSLASLFQDIYENQNYNRKQLDVLTKNITAMVKDGDTALQIVPMIKEYLEINVRNDELQAVVQMRSNDVVFGYKNDYAWQQNVLESLSQDLGIDPGFITWQVQNLHVYERHFHLVE